MLGRALDDLRDGRGGLVIIEGAAGLGKSGLVAELIDRAAAIGITALVASADPIESNTPYFAWRPVLSSLLGIADEPDPSARLRLARARLGSDPEVEAMLPLLDEVLGLEFPATEVTGRMTGEVRADNTRELLVRLVAEAADSGPLVLVLEDAHWLDATSWGLAAAVAESVRRVLLVVTARPREDYCRSAAGLMASPTATRLRLAPLSAPELVALACDRLGVRELPEAVAAILRSRAEGNPLYGEELALSLRDAGVLLVEGGACRLAHDPAAEEIALPDGMRGAILGRIDRLDPSQQLTLKSASVIGRLFHARVLRAIYPIESEHSRVGDDLAALDRLDFTRADPPAQDDAYTFKHEVTREVAYGLMLREQQRILHRSVASWYEREGGPDLSPFFPLLAHHWDMASEADRALPYLDRAGEQALRGGSYREAAEFFARGVAVADRSGPVDAALAARREQALGECHLALGDLVASRAHTSRALALLGWPIPPGRARLAGALVVEIGRRIGRHLRAGALKTKGGNGRVAAASRASAAYAVIGQLCYFDQDLLLGVHATLRSLNLAESAGPSPQLARSYATASVAAGFVPLPSASRYYARRASEMAHGVDDLQARAWVLELVGISELDAGRWADARLQLEEAIRIADRINDRRRWSESVGELARLELHRGDFSRAMDLFASVFERACRHGHDQARTWGLHGQALCGLRMGRDAEALALLERSPALSGRSSSMADTILGGGLSAEAHLRLGDREAARRRGRGDGPPHRLLPPHGRLQPRRLRGGDRRAADPVLGAGPSHGEDSRDGLRLAPRVRANLPHRASPGQPVVGSRTLVPGPPMAGDAILASVPARRRAIRHALRASPGPRRAGLASPRRRAGPRRPSGASAGAPRPAGGPPRTRPFARVDPPMVRAADALTPGPSHQGVELDSQPIADLGPGHADEGDLAPEPGAEVGVALRGSGRRAPRTSARWRMARRRRTSSRADARPVVDDQAGDDLRGVPAEDAGLGLVDREPLVLGEVADAGHQVADPRLERLVARERQVVGVAGVGQPELRGQPGEPAVEPAGDLVREPGAGAGPLRQAAGPVATW